MKQTRKNWHFIVLRTAESRNKCHSSFSLVNILPLTPKPPLTQHEHSHYTISPRYLLRCGIAAISPLDHPELLLLLPLISGALSTTAVTVVGVCLPSLLLFKVRVPLNSSGMSSSSEKSIIFTTNTGHTSAIRCVIALRVCYWPLVTVCIFVVVATSDLSRLCLWCRRKKIVVEGVAQGLSTFQKVVEMCIATRSVGWRLCHCCWR